MEKSSIKKNFVMSAVLAVAAIIFPIIARPYIDRTIGPDGIGRVDYANSIISYFALFAQLGIPTYGIRICARVRDDRRELGRTVRELMCINMIMSILCYIVLIPLLFLVPSIAADRTLFIVFSATILLNSIGMEYLYKGLEQYTYITVRSLVFKAIAFVSMFLFVRSPDDYVIYGGLTIFAACASNILNLFHAGKFIDRDRDVKLDLKRHIKPVSMFFFMACATTIYLHLDKTMLGVMCTYDDVGYYSSGVAVKSLLVAVVTSLGNVLLPRAAYYVENGEMDEFRRISGKALKFVLTVSVPLVVFFMWFANESVLFMSGERFLPAVTPMVILMPTLLLIGLTNILGIQILVPLGKEIYVLISEIAGAVINLILNFLLIPRMQASGAAIGTLAAELAVLIVQVILIRKISDQTQGSSSILRALNIRIVLAAAAGLLFSFWIRFISLPVIPEWTFFSDRAWTLIHNLVKLIMAALLFGAGFLLVMIPSKDETVLDIIRTVKNRLRPSKL